MTQPEQLCLEEALEDTPQMRNFLSLFEDDYRQLQEFSRQFQLRCQHLQSSQGQVCLAIQSLSELVKEMATHKLPLDRDDGMYQAVMSQFSGHLDEMSSMQQVLVAELNDEMMFPINKLVSGEFQALQGMSSMYHLVSDEANQTLQRYMKLPKKCSERQHTESVEEVFQMRRKFHISALQYYSSLNALQFQRHHVFMECLRGSVQAHRSFHQRADEALGKADFGDFLTATAASVESMKASLLGSKSGAEELATSIDEQCFGVYYPEPPASLVETSSGGGNSRIPSAGPPNPGLSQKSGYLFIRYKQGLLQPSRWSRAYFFTQGGNLMMQTQQQVAGSLVIDLNGDGVYAESTDCDDRRNVFQIVAPKTKRNVVLQAENEKERDEWIATITNIVVDDSYIKSPGQLSSPLKERSSSSFFSSLFTTGSKQSASNSVSSESAPTTPLAQAGLSTEAVSHWLDAQPIQFDLTHTVEDESVAAAGARTGADGDQSPTSKRVNPFTTEEVPSDAEWIRDLEPELLPCSPHAALIKTFSVRFLGSVEVPSDRGDALITEVIRRVMGARAVHNLFRMTEVVLVVSSEGLWMVEPAARAVRAHWALENIAFWAGHKENNRLYGFITRTIQPMGESYSRSFVCHTLECNSAEEISTSIRAATKIAFQLMLDHRGSDEKRSQETELLLANISQLPDADGHASPITAGGDGAQRADGADHLSAADSNPEPVTGHVQQMPRNSDGDGDERRVEGAECQGNT